MQLDADSEPNLRLAIMKGIRGLGVPCMLHDLILSLELTFSSLSF